jgi:hypothetical protein
MQLTNVRFIYDMTLYHLFGRKLYEFDFTLLWLQN